MIKRNEPNAEVVTCRVRNMCDSITGNNKYVDKFCSSNI